MDLLFKRYASPFFLIDQMIIAESLTDFIIKINDSVEEERLWDLWLHKVSNGKSFSQWKESIQQQTLVVSKSDIETTVNDSFYMIQEFIPST